MTKERLSLMFELVEIFVLFHMVLSLIIVAVVWAILERISGLEFSSVFTDPRYLNRATFWSF